MKKITKTKLALRTESIRNLGNEALSVAQGGKPAKTQTICATFCDSFKCGSGTC